MTTYDTVLSADAITAISEKFGEYLHDLDASIYFPIIDDSAKNFNALKYRHTKLQRPTRSTGVTDYFSPSGEQAQQGHLYDDFYLAGREMFLVFPNNPKINNWLPQTLLDAKIQAEMRQLIKDIDGQMFYGGYVNPDDKDGYVDAGGFITQAAAVADLNGTDSNLVIKGDVWKGLKKEIQTIPLRYRRNLPNMIAMMSENLFNTISAPDRIYEGAKTEWMVIQEQLMGPMTPKQVKIDQVIVTDDILIAGTDTAGTHDRMALFIPDPSILARCVTLPLQPIGETKNSLSISQHWAFRGSLNVFDTAAALLSEQIVWA